MERQSSLLTPRRPEQTDRKRQMNDWDVVRRFPFFVISVAEGGKDIFELIRTSLGTKL